MMRPIAVSILVAAGAAIAAAAPSRAAPSRAKPRRAAPASGPACPTLAPAAPSPAPAEPAPLAASSIAVSVPIALATVQRELDRLIPNLSDPSWKEPHAIADGVCATWFFDRRPISLKMDGARLRITIPGEFGMIAGPHTDLLGCTPPMVSCGDKTAGAAPLPVQVRLSAALSIDPRYRVSAALHNDGTVFLQPCNVVGNVVDAAPAIGAVIDGLIAQQLASWNAAIARSDVRRQVEALWSAIQRPQQVGDDLWLVVHPTELAGGATALDPDTLAVQAVARGAIELVQQPTAPAASATPLPDLAPAPRGVAPGIEIGAAGSISYAALTRQLAAELVGKPQDIAAPSGAVHHITVRDVRVTGPVSCKPGRHTGRCIAVAVELTGDGCGVAYLVGRPAIDADHQEVVVGDLDFSVATSDAAIKAMAWLAHGSLADTLRRQLHFSLQTATSEAKQRLDQALHSRVAGDWRLSGRADRVAFHLGIGTTGLDYAIDLGGSLAVTLPTP
jgi:hypothetical protein